uniref:Uncharacterized protein n=1 Tax=Myripristis murdjan TaxID=586833 RepID=A0A667WT48_9TELE
MCMCVCLFECMPVHMYSAVLDVICVGAVISMCEYIYMHYKHISHKEKCFFSSRCPFFLSFFFTFLHLSTDSIPDILT